MPDSSQQQPPLNDLKLRYPPMPQTLIEAMELMEHPEDLEVRPVTKMVQRDPFVVARLLHTVNSAYYGLRSTVKSAERAVVMLGPVAVAGIVVGMNMLKLRSVFDGPAGDCFLRLVKHNIATAFLSRHILDASPEDGTRRKSPETIGVSFTSGLLHDFGKMVLVYNYPEKAAQFYDDRILKSQVVDDDTRRLEQFLFGHDHTEAGEYLARKLSFPDELVEAIRHHHEPSEFSGEQEIQDIIYAVAGANQAAKALGYAFDRELTWDQLVDHPIWDASLYDRTYASQQQVFDDLLDQTDHLREYVESLTASSDQLGSH